jgi:hypothetical protein
MHTHRTEKRITDWGPTAVRRIGRPRIRWAGHIVRMHTQRTEKRITDWGLTAVRRIGRSRIRWEDDIRANMRKMKIQN